MEQLKHWRKQADFILKLKKHRAGDKEEEQKNLIKYGLMKTLSGQINKDKKRSCGMRRRKITNRV